MNSTSETNEAASLVDSLEKEIQEAKNDGKTYLEVPIENLIYIFENLNEETKNNIFRLQYHYIEFMLKLSFFNYINNQPILQLETSSYQNPKEKYSFYSFLRINISNIVYRYYDKNFLTNVNKLDAILKEHKEQETKNMKAATDETLKNLENLSKRENCTYFITLIFLVLYMLGIVVVLAKFNYLFKDINLLILYPMIIISFTFFIYLIKLHSAANRIRYDYKFKYDTFKIFLYSHNWIGNKINKEEDKNQARKTIITNLMKTLSDNPIRLISNQNNELPVEQIISAVKDTINGKSK
ncbi:hypothetical protein L4F91_04115 [Avibacterium sp. 20-126]|uniref:hypothetical protein n=1 Tax=Avibacterium sp. 20-126 TaxID=2911524 RepID=UPI0021891896|nr:hypothetical protein L4F91_04115 [Avibacterium sp. 20-126]